VNRRIIKALVAKDFSLFFRNRFFAVITLLGLIFYVGVYFLMPKSVDENLEIGFYVPVPFPALEQFQEEGLEIQLVESEEKLKEAVIDGDYLAGIAFPVDITEVLASGQKPVIKAYYTSDIPPEYRDAVEVFIKEMIYRATGHTLTMEVSEEIIGQDMMGMQIPPRDRMRPMLAVFLIIAETMGLANLIAEEVERRTFQALLVTPVTIKDLFAAKGIIGTALAFGQALLFMAAVGGLSQQPLIIVIALFLGAVLATAAGFLIAALGKDFMTVLAWSMVIFIIFSIPAFSVMFPGSATGWIKAIPSYYLVDTVHRASNFGAGWSALWLNLLILLGVDIVLGWIGIIALRRKFG